MQLKKKKKNETDDHVDAACRNMSAAMKDCEYVVAEICKIIEGYIYFRHDNNFDYRGDFDRIRFDFVAGEPEPFIQIWHKTEDRADRIVTSYGKKPSWTTRERYYPDE